MVYCSKCGTKNEDEAKVCVNCGASLYALRRVAKHRGNECFGPKREKRFEEECFGLPYGGAIVGIIFGILILVFGVAWLGERAGWLKGVSPWDFVWPTLVIIVGILIIAGVIYGATHR